eukprot:NODE_9244_length_1437_cov_5.482443.p1 GENE.NODE_9244_length_1437_cov_5.482443~~NODE_9244_length_1437_cov_5.482443.p1  ORF type:complete len:377 (+),score=97.77 NODE_9244_length_1437_cov_5.482443:84-1214(+)
MADCCCRQHHAVTELHTPAWIIKDVPATDACVATVRTGVSAIAACLAGTDDRVLVIAGPCSLHDPASAMEYARRLKVEADRHSGELFVVMRTYFEKPRTTTGWKGLINDPYLDSSYHMNDGLRLGRQLLRDITALGMPCATEALYTSHWPYIGDLVSWVAIGARTTECQMHRELASSLEVPVGFKNGTSGDVDVAMDAVLAASQPAHFVGHLINGQAALMHSQGNPHCHVVLRGGKTGPNFNASSVAECLAKLDRRGIGSRVVIDCSHANSNKDFRNQPKVCTAIAEQIRAGARIAGVMIESHLEEGSQALPADEKLQELAKLPHLLTEGSHVLRAGLLRYGVSITDACVDMAATSGMLETLAQAVRERRAASITT